MLLHACELTPGKLLSGGDGVDTLVLPPGLTLQDVVTAGVMVDADIESVQTSATTPPSTCEGL